MKKIAIYGDGDYGEVIKKIYEKKGFETAYFITSGYPGQDRSQNGTKIRDICELGGSDLDISQVIVAMYEDEWEGASQDIENMMTCFGKERIVCLTAEQIHSLSREAFPLRPAEFLSRTEPLSRYNGFDRGEAIDRYYIERFLQEESRALTDARVILEVGEDIYGAEYFPNARHEILDHTAGMDLTIPGSLPFEKYDVFICTQTFQVIYDVKKAIEGAWSVLKPGGVLLATVCGCATQLSKSEEWDHFWGFTESSFGRLLREQFGEDVRVKGYGNAMAATAFIQGVSLEETDIKLLDINDSDYSVCICAAARK